MANQPDFADDYKSVLNEQLIKELQGINDGITGIQQTVDEMKTKMATKDDIKRLERHLHYHDAAIDQYDKRLGNFETSVTELQKGS